MSRDTNPERELRDPALTALLRETYAEDPALEPAPGRGERIMRAVLATERRRAGVPPFWAAFGWGASATAAAAVIAVLLLGGMPSRQNAPIATNTDNNPHVTVADQPKETQPGKTLVEDNVKEFLPDTPQAPTPQPNWRAPRPPLREVLPRPWQEKPARPLPRTNPAPATTPAGGQTEVAAALYDVATIAYNAGDYETAYEAYQDSYAAVPTPDAILASGRTLMRLSQDELAAADGGNT